MLNNIQVFIKKYKVILILIAVVVIGVSMFLYFNSQHPKTGEGDKQSTQNVEKDNGEGKQDNTSEEVPMQFEHYMQQPHANLKLFREPVKVKGIYVSGWVVGTGNRFNQLVNLVNDTQLNAMVIDVKEDAGRVTYPSSVPWVKETDAAVNMVGDIQKVMETLKKNNIFPIARIVCFKDPSLGEKHPELAIKTKDGSLWRDNKKNTWLNPYNPESWEYLIELSKEAVRLGFKEIQYDYVRFPTDGNVNLIDYGQAGEAKTKSQAIAEFLAYAKKELEPMGVDVTADIFGIAPISKWDAQVIGQEIELVAKDIDYICPMVYPSHYANIVQNGVGQRINGVLFERPDLDPYGVVYHTLIPTQKKLDESNAKAKVRPWLQAFTAGYLGKGNYQVYGGEQIKQQIKATYDAGMEEWILWDPNNKYVGAEQIK